MVCKGGNNITSYGVMLKRLKGITRGMVSSESVRSVRKCQ